MRRTGALTAVFLAVAAFVAMPCRAQQPFAVTAELKAGTGGGSNIVALSFSIPENHHIYADEITVQARDGAALVPWAVPEPEEKPDPSQDGVPARMYGKPVVLEYAVGEVPGQTLAIKVGYRGCNDRMCFLPQSKLFELPLPGTGTKAAGAEVAETGVGSQAGPRPDPMAWTNYMDRFEIAGKQDGYMRTAEFLSFLDGAESGEGAVADLMTRLFDRGGLWVAAGMLLAVLGGLGLNLTPCVLPMIPINVAIIGAGARAGSRRRGFTLGAVYGGAMALVYGLLGLLVVKAGYRFGNLNSSPLFNGAVAVVFAALSLAMFGVFNIDFSRFQEAGPGGGDEKRRPPFLAAFIMGGIAALLAGACVAPAVVSVLLLAMRLCDGGVCVWSLLPFMLGLGMGLPWPFLGAGLSFLPKPGRWMARVKYAFGVAIMGFALYQGYLAYELHADRARNTGGGPDSGKEWIGSLEDGLREAAGSGKPVFVDFWAKWCKNCLAMDATTFKDPAVMARLDRYVKVKYRADDQDDPAVAATQHYFGSIGLPTYVVLIPGRNNAE